MLTAHTPIEKLIIALMIIFMIVIVFSNYGKLITNGFNRGADQIERAGR